MISRKVYFNEQTEGVDNLYCNGMHRYLFIRMPESTGYARG